MEASERSGHGWLAHLSHARYIVTPRYVSRWVASLRIDLTASGYLLTAVVTHEFGATDLLDIQRTTHF